MRTYNYKTDVSETSVISYKQEIDSGRNKNLKAKAISVFESATERLTALELSKLAGIKYGTACSICNSLFNDKKIIRKGKKLNVTKKLANAYVINPNDFLEREERLKIARDKIDRGKRKMKAGFDLIQQGVKEYNKEKSTT